MARLTLNSQERQRRRTVNAPGVATAPPNIGLVATILGLTPLGYWKLDEDSGTTATDSSGNARNGTYSGTVTLNTWAGPDQNYADFGGGRVEIADNNVWSINTAPGLTVVALIRPETAELGATNRRFIASKGNTSAYEWGLHISLATAGRLRADVWDSLGAGLQGEYIDSALDANEWNFVAFATPSSTKNARFDLYGDSSSPAASTQGTPLSGTSYSNGTSVVNIGNRADSPANGSWNGGIAHLAIFAGQLSASAVGSIYNAAAADGWFL